MVENHKTSMKKVICIQHGSIGEVVLEVIMQKNPIQANICRVINDYFLKGKIQGHHKDLQDKHSNCFATATSLCILRLICIEKGYF